MKLPCVVGWSCTNWFGAERLLRMSGVEVEWRRRRLTKGWSALWSLRGQFHVRLGQKNQLSITRLISAIVDLMSNASHVLARACLDISARSCG